MTIWKFGRLCPIGLVTPAVVDRTRIYLFGQRRAKLASAQFTDETRMERIAIAYWRAQRNSRIRTNTIVASEMQSVAWGLKSVAWIDIANFADGPTTMLSYQIEDLLT